MKERILITGSNGYMGNALMYALKDSAHEIMGVDTGDRSRWVAEVGGASLTQYPVANYFRLNLQNIGEVVNTLSWFRPTIIMHLASQPSGPYSEISYQHRIGTQVNNLSCLMNLLCAVKDLSLDTRFVVCTTTGVAGAPHGPIEEGQSLNMAGSCYHVSRGFDSANLQLASKQWKMKLLELRTSIVYGTRINDVPTPITRLDWDFWFGTVLHRFILAKKTGLPIRIYGKGLQEKPFISLADCTQSLVNALSWDIRPGHDIMNQTTHCLSVKTAAELVGGDIQHIPNPRVENEEYHMVIHNSKFMKLLGQSTPTKDDIVREITSIGDDMNTDLLPLNWTTAYDGQSRPAIVRAA